VVVVVGGGCGRMGRRVVWYCLGQMKEWCVHVVSVRIPMPLCQKGCPIVCCCCYTAISSIRMDNAVAIQIDIVFIDSSVSCHTDRIQGMDEHHGAHFAQQHWSFEWLLLCG
jgi:hypothetical protein